MTRFLWLFFISLVFGLISIYSYSALAAEVDLGELFSCDPLYCPAGALPDGEDEHKAQQLRQDVGIKLPSTSRPSKVIQPQKLVSLQPIERRSADRQKDSTSQEPRVSATTVVPSDIDVGGTGSSSPYNVEASSVSHTEGSEASKGEASSLVSPPSFSNMGNRESDGYQATRDPRVRGGYIYSDDPTPSGGAKKTTNSFGQHKEGNNQAGSIQALTNAPNPVDLNRQNDNSGRQAQKKSGPDREAASASGFGGNSHFGRFQGNGSSGSGSSNQPKESNSWWSSPLEAISELLGKNNFASVSGGSGSRGRTILSNGKQRKTRSTKGGPQSDSPLLSAKEILKSSFNKHRQGLGNHPEFGASNSNIFTSMCKHYNHYALKHRIPRDEENCPQN